MTPHKDPIDQVANLLADMGQTASEVADVLRARGCRGNRHGYFPSPVIRYVYRKFDHDSLHLAYSRLMRPEKLYLYPPDAGIGEIALPPAVASFLDAFDQGQYPELELSEK
jgi:hypothetical protein